MKTIRLRVDQAVIADDPNHIGPGQHGGNVGVETGDKLGWLCMNSGHKFLVRFYRFGTSDGIWPFVEPADLTTTDPTIEYLRVESTSVKTTTLNTTETLKYEVKVERGPTGAVPLDPTIIIRSKNLQRDIVAVGVTAAVLGAVVGALLVAWWT
jgi:hypothetical protein